jgi:hypothetical protein
MKIAGFHEISSELGTNSTIESCGFKENAGKRYLLGMSTRVKAGFFPKQPGG